MEYRIENTAPAGGSEVVPLTTAKLNSEIELATHDALYQTILDAAVNDAEQYTGISILQRDDVKVYLKEWPSGNEPFELPISPVRSISSIKYFDYEGAEQTLLAAKYQLGTIDPMGIVSFLEFDSSEKPNISDSKIWPITITLNSGWVNADIPAAIKSAVLMRFSHKELYREDVPTSENRMFQSVLRPFKRWG